MPPFRRTSPLLALLAFATLLLAACTSDEPTATPTPEATQTSTPPPSPAASPTSRPNATPTPPIAPTNSIAPIVSPAAEVAAEPPWLDRSNLPVPVFFPSGTAAIDETWLYVDPNDGSTFTSPLFPPDVPIDLTTATVSPYWLVRSPDGPEGPGVAPYPSELRTAVLSPNGDVWNIGPIWTGAVSPDGSYVAAIPDVEGETLEVIDVRDNTGNHDLGDLGKPVSLAWSTDNVLAIATGDALLLAHAPDWIPVAATAFEVNANRVAWSPDGTRIAFFEDDGLYVVDRALTEKHQLVALKPWTSDSGRRPSTAAINQAAQWSPDGTRIAYTTGSAIHVIDVATGAITPATPQGVASFFLTTFAWSPDGTRIAVASEHPDHRGIVIAYADGTGAYQLTQSVAFSILGWSDIGIATYLCACP